MKKYRSRLMFTSIFVIIAMSVLYFTFTEDISAQLEEMVFVTHTGGVIKTTGEVLDPLYTSATMEFDPM